VVLEGLILMWLPQGGHTFFRWYSNKTTIKISLQDNTFQINIDQILLDDKE